MLKYRITIFLIFISLASYCQDTFNGSISGKVIDIKTKLPISNANILLIEKNVVAYTDNNGEFAFNSIYPQSYKIKVNVIGYENFLQNIELAKNQNLILNISLKEAQIVLKEVQIIATKEKDLIDQPQRISTISTKTITSAPVHNIHELIDYTSGVNMSNTMGIFSSRAVVTLRGMPSNNQSRTLIILDGVPLNKSDEGSVNWNMINKNKIENIKITKGPGPAKFGAGAMGGVIELTSKKPQKNIEGNINFDYGTYNTMSSNLDIGGVIKDSMSFNQFYWTINCFGRKSDGYITELSQLISGLDTFFVPSYLKEYSTSAKVGYNYKNKHNFEFQTGYFDDKRGNGEKVFEKLGAFSTHNTLNFIGSYAGNSDYLKWRFNFFSTTENYIRQYEYMSEGEYSLYEADAIRQDLGGTAEMSILKFQKQIITTGINFKQGSVNGSDIYFTSSDKITNKGNLDNYAFFIQDEFNLWNEKLKINFGLRYDYAKFQNGLFIIEDPSYRLEFYKNFENINLPQKNWDAFSPRFFTQYMFSKDKRIYFSVAKGFRAPILDDMTRIGKKKGSFKISNPDLNPELLTSYELGSDFNINKKITFGSSFYYSLGKDFMYNVSTGDSVNMGYIISPILKTQNISQVEIYGAEFEIKYDIIENLNLFSNFSFTNAQIKAHKIKNTRVDSCLTGKYLTDIPKYKITAGISWNNRIVNSVVLFKYVGKTWINDMNTLDNRGLMLSDKFSDYFTFNLRFDKNFFKQLNVSLSIENLLNKKYITSELQNCPGRFITAAIKYNFR